MERPTDDAVWVCRATYGLCTEHSVIDGHDRCGWYAPADRDRGDLEELRAALAAFGSTENRSMDIALAWDVIDAASRLASPTTGEPEGGGER